MGGPDGPRTRATCTANLRALSDGAVNFAPIFTLAKNRVRYYLYEYDPVAIGNNGGFNPFTTANKSRSALTGAPAPVAGTSTPSFASVPAGTAAAANQVPVKVTNLGDSPLTFTTAAPTIAAEANDGGTATAADFAVVGQDCSGKTLAPGTPAVADDPTTESEAKPAVPGESCTINVGFKPTRNQLHVGRAPAVRVQLRRLARARPARRVRAGSYSKTQTFTLSTTTP